MKRFTAYSVLLALLLPLSALAIENPETTIPDTLGGGPSDFLKILNTFINWIFTLLLVLAVIFILLAAYNYLTSSGEEKKIATAHKMLIYTAVAIVVALLARGIVALTQNLTTTQSSGNSSRQQITETGTPVIPGVNPVSGVGPTP